MKIIYNLVCLCIFSLVLSSCSKYEKLLKSNDFALKYSEGNRYFAMHKIEKALRLYENVMPFYRSRPQEDTLNMQIAQCYYLLYDYITAEYYFDYVRTHFLRSPYIEQADYIRAMCSYNMVMRAELDQSQTYDAIQKLEYYNSRHRDSVTRYTECQNLVHKLEVQLAYKSYLNAKLYYQMDQYKAAIVALKNSIKQYPESPYREEMLFLTMKSAYLYAENSMTDKQQERYQATIDEYLTLISEYPHSMYKKEADNYYQKSMAHISTEKQADNIIE